MTTPSTSHEGPVGGTPPIRPDRLREILKAHARRLNDGVGISEVLERDLRALIASERTDAARKERERCAQIVDAAPNSAATVDETARKIRARSDEETP